MSRPPVTLPTSPLSPGYNLNIEGRETSDYCNYQFLIHNVSLILKSRKRIESQASRSAAKKRSAEKFPKRAANHSPAATSESPRPLALERRKQQKLPLEAATQIKELEALARSLIQAGEQQQQTISRELHDNIAQVLTAITNRISLAKDEKIPAWLRQELLDLREQLGSALRDVRTLARNLRPALLDHFGFAAALEKHADAFRERTRITLDVRVEPVAISFFDSENLTHLFRLTQEALQNIEEHSGATHAWIRLEQNNGMMHLEIGDNGRAFTPERVVEAQKDGHLGLLGIRERAEIIGGSLLLEAMPDRGTIVRVKAPPAAHTLSNLERKP